MDSDFWRAPTSQSAEALHYSVAPQTTLRDMLAHTTVIEYPTIRVTGSAKHAFAVREKPVVVVAAQTPTGDHT
jgi:hypothetical protein